MQVISALTNMLEEVCCSSRLAYKESHLFMCAQNWKTPPKRRRAVSISSVSAAVTKVALLRH